MELLLSSRLLCTTTTTTSIMSSITKRRRRFVHFCNFSINILGVDFVVGVGVEGCCAVSYLAGPTSFNPFPVPYDKYNLDVQLVVYMRLYGVVYNWIAAKSVCVTPLALVYAMYDVQGKGIIVS